jgi:hypothetical protein
VDAHVQDQAFAVLDLQADVAILVAQVDAVEVVVLLLLHVTQDEVQMDHQRLHG